jgi:hypothetical protein
VDEIETWRQKHTAFIKQCSQEYRERHPEEQSFESRVRGIVLTIVEEVLREVILPEIYLVDERLNAQRAA